MVESSAVPEPLELVVLESEDELLPESDDDPELKPEPLLPPQAVSINEQNRPNAIFEFITIPFIR